ncbi:hypothetical protein [Amycolatopsis sp. lyj-23]|uniref:hypothetical protein n=1 Tax=Amycolatopsis sp. lyj-23 TaxID=2789283 RepID=UPI0039794D2C
MLWVIVMSSGDTDEEADTDDYAEHEHVLDGGDVERDEQHRAGEHIDQMCTRSGRYAMTFNIAINPNFPHPPRYGLLNAPHFLVGGALTSLAWVLI